DGGLFLRQHLQRFSLGICLPQQSSQAAYRIHGRWTACPHSDAYPAADGHIHTNCATDGYTYTNSVATYSHSRANRATDGYTYTNSVATAGHIHTNRAADGYTYTNSVATAGHAYCHGVAHCQPHADPYPFAIPHSHVVSVSKPYSYAYAYHLMSNYSPNISAAVSSSGGATAMLHAHDTHRVC
ncbi:MAG: hypothetical protein Q8P59_11770, partial [Dehalococcoidia bacterium]|nr:hypothetical protein [Dehalococcoidia bacterium]